MDTQTAQPGKRIHWPKTGRLITGILFIILGGILLFGQLIGEAFIRYSWPLFLILGGLAFFAAYYIRSEKPAGYEGLLFPGTYLAVLGLLFLAMNIIGWQVMRYFWPTFILGVPLGLMAMYFLGPRSTDRQNKELLAAIRILLAIAAVLYIFAAGGLHLWPLALIIIGVFIIFKGFTRKNK